MTSPQVDVEVLWELLHEQGGRFSGAELADLALGRRDAAAVTAVEAAVRGDRLRFRDRKGMFEPRAAQSVREALRQQELTRQRLIRRDAAVAAARLALSGGTEFDWDEHGELLAVLEEFAVAGDDAPIAVRETAEELLKDLSRSKGGPWMAAVRALTALGRFAEDENLLMRRHRVPVEFGPPVNDEVAALAAEAPAWSDPARIDRTGVMTVAIDDVDTDEVDDALSAQELPDGTWQVEVHIADASAWVPAGGAIDAEARRRGATLYLPDRRVPMLPPALAYELISLAEGQDRAALTFRFHLDQLGRILLFEPLLTTIRVDCQLPYEEVDSLLEARSGSALAQTLRPLFRLADLLCRSRIAAGALEVQPPEIKLKVDASGAVRVTPVERFSAARRLVSEWMIQSGQHAALWCVERGVPVVYRRQDAPDDPPEMPTESMVDAVAFHSIVRKLRKANVSSAPGPHWGLGVQAYTQVTSPIRRYADLQMHRQIKRAVAAPAGTDVDETFGAGAEEAVLHAVAAAEQAGDVVSRIERETNRYYTLKYLAGRKGEPLRAVVVAERDRGRWLVSIEEVALMATVGLAGTPKPRDVRAVEVVAASPRDDRLQLREVGQPPAEAESEE